MDAGDLAFAAAMVLFGSIALAFGRLTGWRTPYVPPRADEPMTRAPDPWPTYWDGKAALRREHEANMRAYENQLAYMATSRRRRIAWPAAQWIRT